MIFLLYIYNLLLNHSMKKLVLFLSLLFFLSKIFAFDNKKDIQPIFCPQKIICSNRNPTFNLESCYYEEKNNSKYFGSLKTAFPGSVYGGIYSLISVHSSFHSSYTRGYCEYKFGGFPDPNLHLEIKPEANIEAHNNSSNRSKWAILSGGEAICTDSSTKSCPLKNRLGFVIHNLNVANGIRAISNGINLLNNATGNNLIDISGYAAITDEDALVACGNVPTCNIDIISGKSLKYGSMVIDMDTMEIIEIKNDLPAKIQIQKIDPFNSIEIGYQNLLKKI